MDIVEELKCVDNYLAKEAVDMIEDLRKQVKFESECRNGAYADVEIQNAKMRAKKLEFGPGGIMDMKQTIADKEAMIYSLESQIGLMKNYADAIDKENELLQKYRDFVIMIASEQLELSQEKAQLQQRDWRSKAVTLTNQLEFNKEDTSPLDDDF